MNQEQAEFLTSADIMERCNITPSTFLNWVKTGILGRKLPAVKVSNRWRVTPEDFEAWEAYRATLGNDRGGTGGGVAPRLDAMKKRIAKERQQKKAAQERRAKRRKK